VVIRDHVKEKYVIGRAVGINAGIRIIPQGIIRHGIVDRIPDLNAEVVIVDRITRHGIITRATEYNTIVGIIVEHVPGNHCIITFRIQVNAMVAVIGDVISGQGIVDRINEVNAIVVVRDHIHRHGVTVAPGGEVNAFLRAAFDSVPGQRIIITRAVEVNANAVARDSVPGHGIIT
jgi:hypothetical protein